MTKAEFSRRWRRDIAHAERTLLSDGSLAPLLIVVGSDGGTRLMPLDLRDDTARARSINAARLLAVSVDAELVLVRTEVWVVVGGELAEGVAPALSDRRVEAVVVAAAARIGSGVERRVSLREIVRGQDGRAVGLRDLKAVRPTSSIGGVDGWMTDVIPPHRPSPEQQALAAMLLAAIPLR